jgi:hypothetical protein
MSTEERCLATWTSLREQQRIAGVQILEIADLANRFAAQSEIKLLRWRREYLDAGGSENDIERHKLLEQDDIVVSSARRFCAAAGSSVVIDITTFPKRFFFPIVKIVLGKAGRHISNVIATYTVAERYANEALAEDVSKPPFLHAMFAPSFPEPDNPIQIVGVGFEPLGLPEFLKGKEFELLLPVPSPPAGMQRNWDFLRQLEPYAKREPKRLHTYDVSEAFDHLLTLTNSGQRYAIISPYGPKPMSLAMCLYAVSTHSAHCRPAVCYSQPTVYHPDYSLGVRKTHRGEPMIYAYCLRLEGRDLY